MLFTNITRMEVRARRQANFACETFFLMCGAQEKKRKRRIEGRRETLAVVGLLSISLTKEEVKVERTRPLLVERAEDSDV